MPLLNSIQYIGIGSPYLKILGNRDIGKIIKVLMFTLNLIASIPGPSILTECKIKFSLEKSGF